MFITRASRHDKDEVKGLLQSAEFDTDRVDKGTILIARSGAVVGCVRLEEMEPQTVVVDDLVVAETHRGQGIGSQLVRAAMNNRGGTLYLSCHEDARQFYPRFGFAEVDYEDLPESVQTYMRETDTYPFTPEHPHFFMKAR